MKRIIFRIALISLSAQVALAAGTDFRSLIIENSKAQEELHAQIKNSVEDTHVAVREVKDGAKTISIASDNIHVKTDKKFLTFEKEKKYYKPSEAKSQKRLAEEFQNLE